MFTKSPKILILSSDLLLEQADIGNFIKMLENLQDDAIENLKKTALETIMEDTKQKALKIAEDEKQEALKNLDTNKQDALIKLELAKQKALKDANVSYRKPHFLSLYMPMISFITDKILELAKMDSKDLSKNERDKKSEELFKLAMLNGFSSAGRIYKGLDDEEGVMVKTVNFQVDNFKLHLGDTEFWDAWKASIKVGNLASNIHTLQELSKKSDIEIYVLGTLDHVRNEKIIEVCRAENIPFDPTQKLLASFHYYPMSDNEALIKNVFATGTHPSQIMFVSVDPSAYQHPFAENFAFNNNNEISSICKNLNIDFVTCKSFEDVCKTIFNNTLSNSKLPSDSKQESTTQSTSTVMNLLLESKSEPVAEHKSINKNEQSSIVTPHANQPLKKHKTNSFLRPALKGLAIASGLTLIAYGLYRHLKNNRSIPDKSLISNLTWKK